ncbi:MAG: molybdopterin-dependent oxidoreductase [Dehalococcoidales bacterium]|nr:molybdopterin-dependent oxidoreductase [Dehalococcoidales bacterium]
MSKVTLTVNGVKHQVEAGPDQVLLDYLRQDLRLTGAKQSCDRKGQCGACTVIVDGKAVRSCLRKLADLDGANIITVEGLGTPENPHLIQEAFVLAGAVQCGFCTPGMIMATKALLDQNPNPGLTEIKKALTRNLCRCTGYRKIIDAVLLSAKFLRNESTPEAIRGKLNKKKMLGESHERPSAMIKACGVAQFGADIQLPKALEMAVVHSAHHHAKIKSIDASAALSMPGVAGVMKAEDIKGTNRVRVIMPDQPVLCEDVVRTYGDPIAIVAAETRDQARKAAAAVKVEYEVLPTMLNIEDALDPGAVQIHKHAPNLCFTQPQIKGDADKALSESAYVVEGEFSTQMVHQSPLEPEVCLAYLDGEGENAQLVIYGRSIMIHAHAGQVGEAVGWKNVRYKEPFVGGQFGIKASISSEALTAAAALHFKRPIRYIPSLEESFWISSKRHGTHHKVKIGADKEGHLTAYTSELTFNKGAYFALGFIPLTRALLMFSGSYNIPNVNVMGKLVYTNQGFGGAARGAGPPQAAFAMESMMDMLAEKLNIDKLEFRKMNSLKPGQTKSVGIAPEIWTFPEVCDAIKPHWEKARKDAREFNSKGGPVKRGVGIGAFSFGIGETADEGIVQAEIDPDDKITIYAAIADPGEGNDSMLTQIAAHVLDVPQDRIRLYTRDTDKTVYMGPAAASRMTFMGGGATVKAVEQLKKAMDEAGSKTYEGLKKAGKATRYEGIKKNPGTDHLDPKTGQGAAFLSEVQNIQMAEVEVNTETGATRVIKMTTAVDSGVIIHPQNLEGQIEGGMDQGIGYALREEYIPGKSKDWITIKFPTIDTSVDMELIPLQNPRPNGPLGATGIGEMTMVSTAPAVINAIYNACGVRIFDLPATPEKVKAALAEK